MKNVNWKELIIDHIEKGVLGLAGLIILVGLATTSWGTYDKRPSEFAEKVKTGEQNFQEGIWPEKQSADFEAEDPGLQVGRLFDGSRTYPYSTRWILPLNKRKEKIKEPGLQRLESVVADAGRMLMEILPDPESSVVAVVSNDPASAGTPEIDGPIVEGPRVDAPRAGAGGAPSGLAGGNLSSDSLEEAFEKGPGSSYEGEDEADEDGEGEEYPGMSLATTKVKRGTARGTRFVAVRGVFPVKKQVEQLKTALNLETSVEAYQELVFWDFEMERQTAVSGPDPWAGDWEAVDIQYALELLSRTDFDTDPVPARFKDATNTMPLPYRVTGNWDREEPNGRILASHPRIKQVLTAEQREQQEEENAALIEATRKTEEEKKKNKRGFSVVQHDTRNLARTVTQNSDMRSQYMEMMKEMDGGGEDGESGEFNPAGISGYPGAGGYGTQGGYGLAKVTEIPELILFRFLDFNVIPGNAYRYRVRLIIQNPNFGRDAAELENISLRERETRNTEWSDPSPPSVVKDQTEFYVHKMDERRGATIDVHEWSTETGSFLSGRFENVLPGDQIARWREENTRSEGYKTGTGIETAVLRPYEETYEDETIDFVTPNTLVDIDVTKLLNPEDHPDLEVEGRAVKFSLNELVMVNRFGELVQVDSVAQTVPYQRAVALIQRQEKVWEVLRNKANQPEQSQYEQLGGDLSEEYGEGPANPYGTGGNTRQQGGRRRSSLKRSRQQMMQMMGEDGDF